MYFFDDLKKGILINRYKRFLMDIKLFDDHIETIHCPNSGSMKSCYKIGDEVYISKKLKPVKLKYGLEMIDRGGENLVVVNTMIANKLVYNSLLSKDELWNEYFNFDEIKREVSYAKNSRVDILGIKDGEECFIEIKSVSMIDEDRYYSFPDAKTIRGVKHLESLKEMKSMGKRAVMLYVCMRNDGNGFRIAEDIDELYGKKFIEAKREGVEMYYLKTDINLKQIRIISIERL